MAPIINHVAGFAEEAASKTDRQVREREREIVDITTCLLLGLLCVADTN